MGARGRAKIGIGLALALGLGLGLGIQSDALAEDNGAQLSSQVTATEIALDEVVQLTVQLTRDAREVYRGYTRPDFSDFDVLHQGEVESSQWAQVNGQQMHRTTEQHVYALRPRHKGNCVIPAATARLGSRELHTAPITIRVHAAPRRVPGVDNTTIGAVTLPSAPAPEGMRGDEDVFLEARADRTQVFLGEPVIVTWMVYTQSDLLRYRTTVEPKHDDFWSEDLFVPPGALAWDRVEVKGRGYQAAVLLKRALFPLRSGKVTVSAMEAEATTMQTAFYPNASTVKASRPLTIDALPLPAAGRPDGFEPTNVGRFTMTAAVDKDHVKAGETLSFRVTVRGTGNIRNVKVRKLEHVEGFKVYEPSLAEHVDRGDVVSGERVYTYLLLPEKGGDLVVPSVTLAWFDPVEKKYDFAKSEPIAVHVEGDPSAIGAHGGAGETKENLLGARLRPLRNVHRVASRIGERILRGPALAIALLAPPGILFVLLVGSGLRRTLARETEGRRRRRARAGARRRLREAEVHIKAQRPSQFFGECARALYEHLEWRLGTRCEALTLTELRALLVARGFDAELTEDLVGEIESADFARFAPSASGPGEMRAALRRVRTLLTAIERTRAVGEAA